MRKLGIALFATLIVAGFVVLVLGTKRPPPVSVRPFRVYRLHEKGTVFAQFAVSNPMGHRFMPKRLEIWTGSEWTEYQQVISNFTQDGSLLGCTLGQVPAERLRLVLQPLRPTKGLATFWPRVQLRMFNVNCSVPLNPFDTTYVIYSPEPQREVISDEFTPD